ncbi:MAG: acyl-[acyl-carrier-protein] thioesterase [Lachnospiraceae bacterium]|nr:acyl-[acyl-carrier-protein] thioesterase [Lachnospiraceae bacterium]
MYSFQSRVRYSEIDTELRLTLPSLINYYQDASTFQSEGTPCSLLSLKERHLAWMICSWQVEIYRYPLLNEAIVSGTIPYEIKGFFGKRNYFLETADGEKLSWANSIWALIDTETMRPSRIPEDLLNVYELNDPLPMEYSSRKLPFPKTGEISTAETLTVHKRDLDTNNHMNNEQYIRMALDCLPEIQGEISGLKAEYLQQALLGDDIFPKLHIKKEEDKCVYTVALGRADGKNYCVVEFTVI